MVLDHKQVVNIFLFVQVMDILSINKIHIKFGSVNWIQCIINIAMPYV
jgi:hypothetical protein